MKKIAIITSGGDAPGMNAAIRAVVRKAIFSGLEVIGIQRGFCGLIDGEYTKMHLRSVSGIINRGGTILKTVRCPEIRSSAGLKKAVATLKQLDSDGLVIIGGDGSLAAGNAISKHGIAVINIPASIDNDIFGTDETIGFDTALNTAVEAIDKIRDTAASHERVFIVEVMGRKHGFLALGIGVASGAEFVIIPEIKTNIDNICAQLNKSRNKGKTSLLMVFAEGTGNPRELADKIQRCTGLETRVSSLGYIQRGGNPSGRSRILASQFGTRAVELLLSGKKNRLVVKKNGIISDIPIEKAIKGEKKIDMQFYRMAKELSS
jgi:6-phosphofructokinase 1